MSIGKRLNLVIEYYNMTHNSFAKSLGMHNGSNIKRLITLNRTPQIATVNKISKAYPNLNMDWLRTGTGEMIIGDKTDIKEDDLTVTAKQILKKLEEDRVYYDTVREEMNTIKFKELFDNFKGLEGRVESYAIQASQTVNNKLNELSKNYNDSYLVAIDKILRIEQDLENINTFMAQAFETEQIKSKLKPKLKINPNERT